MTYSYEQLKQLWITNGGSPSSASIAAAVAMAESSGNPTATNHNSDGSTDRGLWQINSIHGNLSTTDPTANVRAAIKISSNGKNWKPWVTFTTGKYRQFLNDSNDSPTSNAEQVFGLPTPFGDVEIPGFKALEGVPGLLGDQLSSGIEQGMVAVFNAVFGPIIREIWWGLQVILGASAIGLGGYLIFSQSSIGKNVQSSVMTAVAPEAKLIDTVRTKRKATKAVAVKAQASEAKKHATAVKRTEKRNETVRRRAEVKDVNTRMRANRKESAHA